MLRVQVRNVLPPPPPPGRPRATSLPGGDTRRGITCSAARGPGGVANGGVMSRRVGRGGAGRRRCGEGGGVGDSASTYWSVGCAASVLLKRP
eukprot:355182-Chlamydomonas_euryale.AAC.4